MTTKHFFNYAEINTKDFCEYTVGIGGRSVVTLMGSQRIYRFSNGYGASVVRHEHSYGGRQGLFELAVLDSNDELCYDTPITNDVIGWLTHEQADELLDKISKLPA